MAQNRYGKSRKHVAMEDVIDYEDDEMISNIPKQVLSSMSKSLARSRICKGTTNQNQGQKRYGKDEKHECIAADTVSNLDEDNNIISQYGEAYCEGWYVILKRSTYECFLWNPTSRQKFRLPTLKKCTSFFSERDPILSKCVLSSPPTLGGCTVLFTSGCEYPRILYCKVDDRQWVEQMYPDDDEFKEVIAFKRKVYAITIFGAMFQIVLGAKRLTFSPCEIEMPFLFITDYLFVDSCEELFLVMTVSITNLAVFRVDFSQKKLIQVYTLGDRIFIISNYYSGSLNGSEWGLRGNHIYYTKHANATLYNLDFEQAIISVARNRSDCSTIWFASDGSMPIPRISNYPTEEKILKNNMEACESMKTDEDNWLKLPLSIQQLIAESYLSHGVDYLNFRLVCKSWKSVAPPFCWRSSKCNSIAYPWLMYIGNNGICNFHDPKDNVTYTMRNHELSDCVIRFSKDGWLLLSHGTRSVFLYEPFVKTKVKLPDLPMDYCFCSLSFSAPPTSNTSSSSCCAVVGISNIRLFEVCICYLESYNNTAWSEVTFEHDWFYPSLSNPVFFYSCCWFMDRTGRLGVFKINDEREPTWEVYNNPKPVHGRRLAQFLILHEKQIYSIFISGKIVEIYCLNTIECEWVPSKSLRNYTLFISQTTSMAVTAHEERMKNKIYTSKLSNRDNHHIFYSLDTKKYHTFDGGFNSTGGLHGTKEYLQSTWIQPSLVPAYCKSSQDKY